LDAYQRNRQEDLQTIQSQAPADRVPSLQERVLRDAMQAMYTVHVCDSLVQCSDAGDLRNFYLWAPSREHVAEDYVALGDALAEADKVEESVHAYENAIKYADGYTPNPEAAARIRLTAFQGEERLWAAHRERFRVKAAHLFAAAEERYLHSPDAVRDRNDYTALVDRSEEAMKQMVREQNSQALAAITAGLQAAQTAVASLPTGKVTPAQMNMALANMNVSLTKRFLEIASSTQLRGPDGAPLKDLLADIPELRAVLEGGDAETTKQAMSVVAYASVRLRRGDPIPSIKAMVRAATPKPVVVAPPAAAPPPPAAAAPPSAAAPPPAAAPAPEPKPSTEARLKKLDELYKQKLLDEREYRQQRERILQEDL
jgi:hypothetical protein